jgi:hypothetical protein
MAEQRILEMLLLSFCPAASALFHFSHSLFPLLKRLDLCWARRIRTSVQSGESLTVYKKKDIIIIIIIKESQISNLTHNHDAQL